VFLSPYANGLTSVPDPHSSDPLPVLSRILLPIFEGIGLFLEVPMFSLSLIIAIGTSVGKYSLMILNNLLSLKAYVAYESIYGK
jgi:hypothetical protein